MADSELGHRLRSLRERRGWGRETLAHHAGVSWAAIAQIEAGRRPDPRMSTVVALADALCVAVDQLTGGGSGSGDRPPSDHAVLLYGTDGELVDATVPFLTSGVERFEAVLVVTERARIRRLRTALGANAKHVSFRESSSWYSSPRATLDSYRSFVDQSRRAGKPWVRIVGEPVWAGRSLREVRAWTRYESMLNVSFAGSPVTIMCPYDTRSLSAGIIADAQCTHPETVAASGSIPSPSYRDPERFLLECEES
jgi:DNA-binding XRE family transcriptional regulator